MRHIYFLLGGKRCPPRGNPDTKKTTAETVGFAAETDELLAHAAEKPERKNLDWIAANLVGVPGCGFAAETNAITLLGRGGKRIELALQSKTGLAGELLKVVLVR